jgi:hypothetical protein
LLGRRRGDFGKLDCLLNPTWGIAWLFGVIAHTGRVVDTRTWCCGQRLRATTAARHDSATADKQK